MKSLSAKFLRAHSDLEERQSFDVKDMLAGTAPDCLGFDERHGVLTENRRICVLLHRSRIPPVHVDKPA